MRERMIEMIRKEFRQAFRDPRMRAVMFFPPIIQLIIFGFAVNLDVQDVRTAWVDEDRSEESRVLRAQFEGSPNFRITAEPATEAEVTSLLDRGRVHLVVRVEKGFGADLAQGRTASVQLLIEGSNSNTASIVANYAQRILAQHSARWLEERRRQLLLAAGPSRGEAVRPVVPRIDLQTRVWFNPNFVSRDYYVPGIVALVITVTTILLTALAIVREKEIGTMEQLMVTPLRPIELMIGKTVPFALVGMIDIVLITVLALLIFGVPFRGSLVVLFASAALYILAMLGLGLFISTVSRTQQQAMMLSFFVTFPVILLSGFAFPIRNMPTVIQWITYLNPMRYFLEIVRAVFLKGIGLSLLWPQFVALAVLGVSILGINSLRFHKRLD